MCRSDYSNCHIFFSALNLTIFSIILQAVGELKGRDALRRFYVEYNQFSSSFIHETHQSIKKLKYDA